jgi:hypothetical protein
MPPIYGKARYMFKRTFTGSGSVWQVPRAADKARIEGTPFL